ncbi:MAG: hypothetical protein AW07_00061 [Candidatus Accumulibacter sp. SK-11]|nr:MAG: hypothetical protein AW07_00061 [Candidatus Accumulibacter sp. SK-11]
MNTSQPNKGLIPLLRAAEWNLTRAKTLARSVSASAGMPQAAARATAASRRTMPSVIENSLCRRRWMYGVSGMAAFYSAALA